MHEFHWVPANLQRHASTDTKPAHGNYPTGISVGTLCNRELNADNTELAWFWPTCPDRTPTRTMNHRPLHDTSDGYIRAWSGDLADELTELRTQLLELRRIPELGAPSEWGNDLHTVCRVLHGIRRS